LIYVPDEVEQAIGLTINQTIEYLVNVFLNDKRYMLMFNRGVKFNSVKELEYFIDRRFIKLSSKNRVKPRYSYYM
jgi:hypothetical protein